MSQKLSGIKPPSRIAKPSSLSNKTPGTSGSLNKSLSDSQPLTLNTDDFIIGDRVWVSGTKPGYIQYIGETQFAPGEWAGVVLDEPIGKNDGSVAGVRYFMCEPKRGVFSRLTKLTRAQLSKLTSSSSDAGGSGESKELLDGMVQSEGSESVEVRSDVDSSIGDENKTNNGTDDAHSTSESRSASNGISVPLENLSLLSPKLSSMGKILTPPSQMKRSNSPGIPFTSKTPTPTARTPGSTDSSPGPHNLKIGDRVLVSGTKAGILRYVGFTEFASGEWAGVELDEMLGKNDGSVAGKRYFDCKPKYGLFAPVHKVTKVPGATPARKLTQQRTGLGTSSSLSRTSRQQSGSQESLSSLSSTSSSLRATRVRLGVTSLTSQKSGSRPGTSTVTATNTALQEALKEKEQHIDQLLKERDLERAEVARAAAQVDEAERRLANLRSEYDRYMDDTDISIRRLNSIIDDSERQKSELLAQLDDERRKIEDLQFRIEEESISKGDLETQTKVEEKKIKELEAQLQEYKAKLSKSDTELELLKASYSSEVTRLNQVEQSSTSYLDQIKELTQQLASSENKIQSLEASSAETGAKANKVTQELSSQKSHLVELETLIEKKKNEIKELTTKNCDLNEKLESSQSTCTKAQETISEMNTKLSTKESAYSGVMAELQQFKLTLSDVQRNFQASEEKCSLLVQDKDKLTVEIAEIMKHSGDSSQQLSAMNEQLREKDRKLEELQNSLSNINQNASRLQEVITQQKDQFGQEKNSLISLHKEECRKWQEKVDTLTLEVNKTSSKMNKLTATHDTSLKELMKKKELELEEMKQSMNDKEQQISDMTGVTETLKKDLEDIKIDLYKHRAEKEKLEKLFQIVDAEKDGLIRERDRLRSDLQGALNNRSESELKLTELAAERDKEKSEAVRIKDEATNLKSILEREKLALSKERIEVSTVVRQRDESLGRLNAEIVRLKDDFSKQKEILEHKLQETQQMAGNVQEIQSELTLTKRSLEDVRKRNQELEHERNSYRAELERLRSVQEEKVQLEGKQSSLKKQLDEMKQREIQLLVEFESDRTSLQSVVDATQKAILQRDRELDIQKTEIIALQGEMSILTTYKTTIQNLELEKKKLEERMVALQSALSQSQANANLHPNYNSTNDPLIIMLKQEKETAESQIEFLNSVIVDMQKKNDELTSKLEVLESGVDLNNSMDLSFENGGHKISALRLFCDICDVFDQHDTDDCPRQSMTDSPPASQYHGNRNETRPYCDICEVFGHWTANCDDNETF